MLIDPNNRNIDLNVEEWKSTIINSQTTSINFKGLTKAIFKGSIRKFECNGVIYKNVTSNVRYLEALSFDDIVEIQLDINNDELDFVNNKIKSVTETIEGYISIESFNTSNTYDIACPYKMSGYFFPLTDFNLKTITSYFNMSDVVASTTLNPTTHLGSLTGQSQTSDVNLTFGEWDHITVSVTGGLSFNLKPEDSVNYMVYAEEIDNGANVVKWQINTCLKERDINNNPIFGDIINISYIIFNRGGFKLETNIAWEIECVGYNNAIFKASSGLDEFITKAPDTQIVGANNVLFIAAGVASVGNYESFYWDLNAGITTVFSGILKTQNITGNIISIAGSTEGAITSSSTGSSLPTGNNIGITEPLSSTNVDIITEGSDKVCYVPVEFVVNDGSLVMASIDIILKLGYSDVTWDFTDSISTITVIDPLDFANGGFVVCKFILVNPPTFYKHAGIEIVITYGSGHEHGYLPYTFSIGADPGKLVNNETVPTGGNGPVKAAIDLVNSGMEDYPIFQMNDMYYGIWDIYFFVMVSSGKCAVDMGLYSSQLSGASMDSDITDWWRSTLAAYIRKIDVVQTLPSSTPNWGPCNLIDYNGAGLHLLMKDTRVFDYGAPSIALFKRTVLIKSTTDTHIHVRMKNFGGSTIDGFVAIAVPLFSHTDIAHFLGDCSNALSPNVKNKILVPT